MTEWREFFHRLEGSTTFKNNRAFFGGGIYSIVELSRFGGDNFEETYGREYRPATITFPGDTVFEDNDADVSLGVVSWVAPQACVLHS